MPSWFSRLSDWLVRRAQPTWVAALPRALTIFGLGVMVVTAAVFVNLSENRLGAAPGTVSLLQLGTAAVCIAGALCFLRVAPDIVRTILVAVVTGAFALSLVTLSVSLPAGAGDPYATLMPTYLVSAIALVFLALRRGFR